MKLLIGSVREKQVWSSHIQISSHFIFRGKITKGRTCNRVRSTQDFTFGGSLPEYGLGGVFAATRSSMSTKQLLNSKRNFDRRQSIGKDDEARC
jgi:hypothetical protein